MSTTISQSVLMALTVTVNQYASSNVYAVNHRNRKVVAKREAASATSSTTGRRGILLSAVLAAYSVNDSKTELLQKYLKKSEENKAKNDKERVDSYYKRNYKDYFEFVEGSLKGKSESELTESEKVLCSMQQALPRDDKGQGVDCQEKWEHLELKRHWRQQYKLPIIP